MRDFWNKAENRILCWLLGGSLLGVAEGIISASAYDMINDHLSNQSGAMMLLSIILFYPLLIIGKCTAPVVIGAAAINAFLAGLVRVNFRREGNRFLVYRALTKFSIAFIAAIEAISCIFIICLYVFLVEEQTLRIHMALVSFIIVMQFMVIRSVKKEIKQLSREYKESLPDEQSVDEDDDYDYDEEDDYDD